MFDDDPDYAPTPLIFGWLDRRVVVLGVLASLVVLTALWVGR